jgi:hypothetical protein
MTAYGFEWLRELLNIQNDGLDSIKKISDSMRRIKEGLDNSEQKLLISGVLQDAINDERKEHPEKVENVIFRQLSSEGNISIYSLYINERNIYTCFSLIIQSIFDATEKTRDNILITYRFIEDKGYLKINFSVNTEKECNLQYNKKILTCKKILSIQMNGNLELFEQDNGNCEITIKIPTNSHKKKVLVAIKKPIRRRIVKDSFEEMDKDDLCELIYLDDKTKNIFEENFDIIILDYIDESIKKIINQMQSSKIFSFVEKDNEIDIQADHNITLLSKSDLNNKEKFKAKMEL